MDQENSSEIRKNITNPLDTRISRTKDLLEAPSDNLSTTDLLYQIEGRILCFSDQAALDNFDISNALKIYYENREKLKALLEEPSPEESFKNLSTPELFDFVQFMFNMNCFLKPARLNSEKSTKSLKPDKQASFLEITQQYFFVSSKEKIDRLKTESLKLLKEKIKKEPTVLRALVKKLQEQKRSIDNSLLDELFEIPESMENATDNDEEFYLGTPYNTIKKLFSSGEIPKNKVLYDIGAGYGRLVFYAALLDQPKVVAVEKNKKRAAFLKQQAEKFQISNLEVKEEDATTVNLSEAEIAYLYSPFASNPALESAFFENLKKSKKDSLVKIIWQGPIQKDTLKKIDWLKKVQNKMSGHYEIITLMPK